MKSPLNPRTRVLDARNESEYEYSSLFLSDTLIVCTVVRVVKTRVRETNEEKQKTIPFLPLSLQSFVRIVSIEIYRSLKKIEEKKKKYRSAIRMGGERYGMALHSCCAVSRVMEIELTMSIQHCDPRHLAREQNFLCRTDPTNKRERFFFFLINDVTRVASRRGEEIAIAPRSFYLYKESPRISRMHCADCCCFGRYRE